MAGTPTTTHDAHDAAALLTFNGRYRVARVTGDRLYLATPATSVNAAESLRRAGVAATAVVVAGRWCVRITAADAHGNTTRVDGVDRCACGCKYWENDRCIDCGGTDIIEGEA